MNIYTVRDILFVCQILFRIKNISLFLFYYVTLLRTDQFPFCTLYIMRVPGFVRGFVHRRENSRVLHKDSSYGHR